MRELRLKREKSLIGCLTKMNVYLEDANSNEVVYNGKNYRKIGVLKNGEENTFLITEDECNIITCSGKLNKGLINEIQTIPAGEYDIPLMQKFKGNRASALRAFLSAITFFLIMSIVLFFGISDNKPKEFSKEGMSITLNNKFNEVPQDGFTTSYISEKVAIYVNKEKFSSYKDIEKYSLKDYADILAKTNNFDTTVKKNNGLTYFEVKKQDSKSKSVDYYIVVYKTSDAFWNFQFNTLDEDFKGQQDNIIEWAKSVNFLDSKK